jgi:hypothetical protein
MGSYRRKFKYGTPKSTVSLAITLTLLLRSVGAVVVDLYATRVVLCSNTLNDQ